MAEQDYRYTPVLAASNAADIVVSASDADPATKKSDGTDLLPGPLANLYEEFKDAADGKFNIAGGFGIQDVHLGPVKITLNDLNLSVVTKDDKQLFVVQGFAGLDILQYFSASCILIGEAEEHDLSLTLDLFESGPEDKKEQEKLAKLATPFYNYYFNNPLKAAESTYGIYITRDKEKDVVERVDVVLFSSFVADLRLAGKFNIVLAGQCEVNTITNTINVALGGSWRWGLPPNEKSFSVAAELGIKNGGLNSFGFSMRSDGVISIYPPILMLTQVHVKGHGFQEPVITIDLGVGVSIGEKFTIPKELSPVRKVLFPCAESFYPLFLEVQAKFTTDFSNFYFSGYGMLIGNFEITVSGEKTPERTTVSFRAGSLYNKFFNFSVSGEFCWQESLFTIRATLAGSFTCSIHEKYLNLTIRGGIDLTYSSRDFKSFGNTYNTKQISVSAHGMAKVKVWFISFNISVEKSFVINLGTRLVSNSSKAMLTSSEVLSGADFDNAENILECESVELADAKTPAIALTVSSAEAGNVIASQSWKVDAQSSGSGVVKFQIAAQHTLLDSSWRLIHTANGESEVYTVENTEGMVTRKDYTHDYCELHLDTPAEGDWTLQILGTEEDNGKFYLEAVKDEKMVTELKILSRSDTAIEFEYSAFSESKHDDTIIALYAEELNAPEGKDPFHGIIAELEETKNGTYTWEIQEGFLNNSNYRFYVSMASSNAALIQNSKCTEEVTLVRQEALLDCSYELVYSAEDTNQVTAFITIKNNGTQESDPVQWKLVDNAFTANEDGEDIVTMGDVFTVKGNSSVTFEHKINITEDFREDLAGLQLMVQKVNLTKNSDSNEKENEDSDLITFSALNSEFGQTKTIQWEAVDGAASYILQYALEGDWDEGAVFVRGITGTEYTLTLAPGEYEYRVIAMDENEESIGSWSESECIDFLYEEKHTMQAAAGDREARSEVFMLNDGLYNFAGTSALNFNGTVTLYREELIEMGSNDDYITLKEKERKICSFEFEDGVLQDPETGFLLDHGNYFWEWSRSKKDAQTESGFSMDLTGEVFSIEEDDREFVDIEKTDLNGNFCETLEGEVGFSNADAVYQYMTDDGGELTISIDAGTVLESKVRIQVYLQDDRNGKKGKYKRVKTVNVDAGTYSESEVILSDLSLNNNFYIKIVSWDNGKGKYNTDYKFNMKYDVFGDSTQHTDILEVGGETINEWIGYRNEEHAYLMQIDENGRYSIRLNGNAGDATLKICDLKDKVIEKMKLQDDGTAYIDDLYLEEGNYFVVVDSKDNGKGKRNTDYTLSATKLSDLYPKINNSDDTWKLASEQDSIIHDEWNNDWLGCGDAEDFFKVELAESGKLVLQLDNTTANAVEEGILEFTCLNEKGKKLALTSLSDGELTLKKDTDSAIVYIGVELQKTDNKDVDYSFKLSMLA